MNNTDRFQIQLRWASHPKGADHWQTMNGVFTSIETAAAAIAQGQALQPGFFTDSRIIVKGSARKGAAPVVVA